MMGMFRKRPPVSSPGPRKNQWKGLRTGQEIEVKRGRTLAGWKTIVRWGGAMTFVGAVVWAGTVGVQQVGPFLRQLLEIHTVTVDGLHRVDRKEILDLAGVKPGMPIHHVLTSAVKARVEAHPWIKEAVVERVPLHEVRIAVVERKPAVVVRAGGENFLGDKEGHVLVRLGHSDDGSLPMVTGIDPEKLLRSDGAVRQAVAAGVELARLMGLAYEGRLSVNAADPENLVAAVRGVQFHFGEDALGDQWQRFQQVVPAMRTLNFDGAGDGASDVDLRYENRVVVRERG
ncbi:MAG: FtsQ-type POTRA domain-containing protein [Nitrospira sp.]|nr:FtsQ-type POTRA domain-containing protein [Nitrospira sp.]